MSIRIVLVLGRGYVLFADGEALAESGSFSFLLECAASLISNTALVLNH